MGDEERLHHMLVGNQLALDCAAFFMRLPREEAKRKKHPVIIIFLVILDAFRIRYQNE